MKTSSCAIFSLNPVSPRCLRSPYTPGTTRSGALRAGRRMMLALALLASLRPPPGEGTQGTFVQTTWRETVHYRATFTADEAATGRLHVAAADSYEVFFNGTRVGSDSVSTRMTAYEIAVENDDNHIGITVLHRGLGGGNGMIAAVVVGDSILAMTTTNRRIQTWRWTSQVQQGSAWTTADVEEAGWQTVQEGTADRSRIEGIDAIGGLPALVAGVPNSVDASAVNGAVVLGRIGGENLALGRPSNHPEVSDGDLTKAWNAPSGALSFFASVDLQERRLIHKVRLITDGRNASQFEANSLRGYSVQVSDDQIRWTEVGVRHDIGCKPGALSPCSGEDVDPAQFEWTEVEFRPTWTRFVRFVIIDVNPSSPPKIAEFEVFGDGFAEEGILLSDPLSVGPSASRKNFGRVRWKATVPDRTRLSVELRAGDAPADFENPDEGWVELESSGAWFPDAEPGRLLQYRILLATNDDNLSPRIEHLEIDFDTEIAASTARGRVAPNRVAMGVDTLFVYHLDLEFADGDLGVEKLAIDVPSAARLAYGATVNDLLSGWESTQQVLTLTFAPPLTQSTRLEIPFWSRTHASAHLFRASMFSPAPGQGSANPLNATENRDRDPFTDEPYSWSIATSTTRSDLLSAVQASPPLITPNGDAVNDRTVVEFVLSVVDTPRQVSIEIFDLNGGLVRSLDLPPVAAGAYAGPGSRGTWDGTDGTGNTVPPGLYLYRVEVGLDTGNEVRSGVIAVAY